MNFKNPVAVLFSITLILSCKTNENSNLGYEYFNESASDLNVIFLFNKTQDEILVNEDFEKAEIRKRLVKVNPEILSKKPLQLNQVFAINLFNNLFLFARIDHIRSGYKNIQTYTGSLLSFDRTPYSISIDDDRILLVIRHIKSRKLYEVFYSRKYDSHIVVEKEIDMDDIIEDDPVLKIDSLKS